MKNHYRKYKHALCLFVIIIIVQECHSLTVFQCSKSSGGSLPSLPKTFSMNARLNYPKSQYTVDTVHIRNENGRKEVLDFTSEKRHVRYIFRGDLGVALIIKYKSDEHPGCSMRPVSSTDSIKDVLVGEDTGPNDILTTLLEVNQQKDRFALVDASLENGIFIKKWEGCFSKPNINASYEYSDPRWSNSYTSYAKKDVNYLVKVEAQIKDEYLVALVSNMDPTTPDDAHFQPPEDVFCQGFRKNPKLPVSSIPNYFSYDAEIVVYESSEGIAPLVSHRKVYYDYPGGISRTDFYDPLAEDGDMFPSVRAEGKTIIHDFTSGIQYNIDPFTGKCILDKFQITLSVISAVQTQINVMPDAKQYFGFEDADLSYNGQYETRGLIADVFTASVSDPKTKSSNFFSWYFTTNRTQVVEKEYVEKNVLLRMVIRPDANPGKKGEVEINFYNFLREEPNVLMYDITSCYNESSSKNLVFTFPTNDEIKGLEKIVRLYVHQAIKDVTGISKQRIFVREVIFGDDYMYAVFKMLEAPPVMGTLSKPRPYERSLEDAVNALKQVVSDGKFNVTVPTKSSVIILRPEPNGLNVFSGDHLRKPLEEGYKEASVIGLTVGMLFLGVILGGITINLIISRKYGVSLFQKNTYGNTPFSNPLGDSSM